MKAGCFGGSAGGQFISSFFFLNFFPKHLGKLLKLKLFLFKMGTGSSHYGSLSG